MTDRPDLRASIAALNGFWGSPDVPHGMGAGVTCDCRPMEEMNCKPPLMDVRTAYTDRTLVDLLGEHQLTVLRGAILKWQIRCRRLEAQVDRLEHELAAAMDDASRLRAACEHSHRATGWGMGE